MWATDNEQEAQRCQPCNVANQQPNKVSRFLSQLAESSTKSARQHN